MKKMSEKIYSNKSIVKSFPNCSDVKSRLCYLTQVTNRIRETLKKSEKIEEIEKNIQWFEQVIDTVELIGYPITARKARRVLIILFTTLFVATKPELNKRTRKA